MSPQSKMDNFSLHLPAPAGAPDVPLDMIFVRGGAFRMGSDENDPAAYADEKPAHDVALPHFFIGKYPVTQALWKAVMQGENPSFFQGDDRPVENVSWDDICEKFLPALNRLLPGFGFRLPTEAEWEYAARGGSRNSAGVTSSHRSMPFHNTPSSAVSLPFGEGRGGAYAGSDRLGEVGWYDANSHGETKPVGLKYPNALGLYDMSGNVWEWCEDDWHNNYKNTPEDGSAWIDRPERGVLRVQRGGSCWFAPRSCRVASRYRYHPASRYAYIGFRLAASFQSDD